MKDREATIQQFLSAKAFAVAGASRDRGKFGNRVLRKYQQHGLLVYPVNPGESEIEGLKAFAKVGDLPEQVQSLSIVTPPEVTLQVVRDAIAKGIPNLWMQPGAEHPLAVREAEAKGLNVIADGSCLLVELG